MIKTIVFDFGNVIEILDQEEFYSIFPRREDYERVLRPHERGEVSSEEFLQNVVSLGIADNKEEVIKAMSSRFSPNDNVIGLIRRIKDSGYEVALLSNIGKIDYEDRCDNCDIIDIFDHKTLSFEVGALKPDKDIYKDILGKVSSDPEECVFIDDKKKNIEEAEKLGINGIVYDNYGNLLERLGALDVRINGAPAAFHTGLHWYANQNSVIAFILSI